jgi:hypothetical protein
MIKKRQARNIDDADVKAAARFVAMPRGRTKNIATEPYPPQS